MVSAVVDRGNGGPWEWRTRTECTNRTDADLGLRVLCERRDEVHRHSHSTAMSVGRCRKLPADHAVIERQ